jgi:hypothetical protein
MTSMKSFKNAPMVFAFINSNRKIGYQILDFARKREVTSFTTHFVP